MCYMTQSCAAIDDVDRRKECFQAAYEGFRKETRPRIALEEERPVPALAPVAPAREPAVVERVAPTPAPRPDVKAPVSEPIPQPAQEPEQETIAKTTTRERQVLEVPDEFSATVTYHQELVRDRQILVLDNELLFEGNEAQASRIKLGDEVDVQRTSRIFEDRFRISSGGRRPFTAVRIRCEKVEKTQDADRKCQLLDQSSE